MTTTKTRTARDLIPHLQTLGVRPLPVMDGTSTYALVHNVYGPMPVKFEGTALRVDIRISMYLKPEDLVFETTDRPLEDVAADILRMMRNYF